MSLLIKNAQVWLWDSPANASSPTSCSHTIVARKWIAVSKEGRFIIPEDDSAALTAEDEMAYDSRIDAAGRLLLPGLIDSHIHVSMTGESIHFVDLKECYSIQKFVETVAAHINKHADLSWIIGVNWDQTKLGRYPCRQDIDAVSAGVKVFLWRACWHIGLANTKALASCGIATDMPPAAVPGGVIDYDGGNVTGILRERAVELIMKAVSNKTAEERMLFIKNGLDMCMKYGLTSVQSNDENALGLYDELQASNQLPIRVFLTPTHQDMFSITKSSVEAARAVLRPDGISRADAGSGGDMRCAASRLLIDRVKIFGDGSLGAETAALRLKGGADKAYKGVLMHPTDAMHDMISIAKRNGYRLEIHAIGDAAAEQVLRSMADCGINPSDRAILTHCQVLGADLVEMMAQMGVIANIQPSFVPTDMEWASTRLTSDVLEYAYAWKTLMASGVWCAGGSDAPVETCSPWVGIHDAIFRQRRLAPGSAISIEDVFRPEECLTFSEALYMYTIGAAYAGSCEGTMGRVANGFAGDFVLVDPNITKAGEDNSLQSLLYGYVPDVVVVGGEIVHISSDSTVPIIISSPELHRGLTSNRAVDTPICMEGPYIPGKNGSFFHSGNADSVDQDVISAGEKKKIAGKKRATMLCQSVTPISNTTMFSSRPTGSCVCILTGAYLKHQNDLESCGMRLRQASL